MATQSAKQTYTVVTAVDHNNRRYEPGTPIDLTNEQARPLLDVNAIAEPPAEPAEK
jgi:hypothetical protein